MESISASEKQSMVSSFLEIAVGQSAETARQFLQATSWKLEEAIQLFYVGNEGGGLASSSLSPPTENSPPLANESLDVQEKDIGNEHVEQHVGDEEVRPPLPVRREVLYDDGPLYRISRMGHPSHEANSLVAFRNFNEESKRPGVWESDQSAASTIDSSRDNLASLYRPPFALMHHGPFDKAKIEASLQDKWLLVNLQSTKEFSSHMLNRDTWANEAVAQTISTNFIFWQVYDDTSEGKKVCTYYNLVSIPVVLVIDPITGQKMRSWNGMIQPERLLEDLLPFMDRGPKDHHVAHPHKRPRESVPSSKQKMPAADETIEEEEDEVLRAMAGSMEARKDPVKLTSTDGEPPKIDEAETCSSKTPIFPSLPEEAKGERHLICRVGIRLPDGRRVQRSFFNTDPIQYLWSFCCSELKEAETRPFRLTQAIPRASKCLDYESKLTFEESGLSNSMITLTWE
ncbi:plant UBX domain-containing protein 7-like isoform X2 [Magnolia sinica]|uniref:plant UBX domain-containing protein 7-like isoform X2 n=1 Tax=Magnolia sinica TaxID=86752 RepID=UPI0026598DBE|nr:plant UBX domain-containing protein 7-like isoform X2 [Magnolia sinica]